MPTYQNIVVIWKRKDKNGKTYLSMKVERDLKAGESLNIFQNEKNGVDTRPDFRAYEKIEDGEKPAPRQSQPAAADPFEDEPPTESDPFVKDILNDVPF